VDAAKKRATARSTSKAKHGPDCGENIDENWSYDPPNKFYLRNEPYSGVLHKPDI